MRRYQIGAAIVDERRRTVTLNSKAENLTDLTWRFLAALIEVSPEPAGPQFLAKTVWEAGHVSDETIAQRVRLLRQAFGDDPKSPSYIRTIRGGGYQLIPKVSELPKPTTQLPALKGMRRGPIIGMGALMTVIAGGLLMFSKGGFDAAPQLTPSATPAAAEMVARAHEYRQRSQYESNEHAIKLYEQVLNLDPKDMGALIGLSYSYSHKASKYEESQQWADRAAELADRALVINAGNGDAWAARGLADDSRGRVSRAITYYNKALELDPANADLRASIAYLLQIQGKLHDALSLETEALSKAAPTYFSDYQIAITLNKAGFDEAAGKWLSKAEQLRPDNVYLLDYKAREMIKSGDAAGARALLGTAPNERISYAALRGITFLLNGQEAKAVDAFHKGRRVGYKKETACYACLAGLAKTDDEKISEEIDSRLSAAALAIENGEEWPEYRVQLAYLYAAKNDLDSAQLALEDAFRLGYFDWKWLSITPLLSPLQDRVYFKDLLSRMQAQTLAQKNLIDGDDLLLPLFAE